MQCQELHGAYPDGPIFPWLASQIARSTGRLEESCTLMDTSVANAAEVAEEHHLDRMIKESLPNPDPHSVD